MNKKLNQEWKEIFKRNNLTYSEDKSYKLECSHKNIGIINLYPFHTLICLKCGFKTERLIEDSIEMKGGLKE